MKPFTVLAIVWFIFCLIGQCLYADEGLQEQLCAAIKASDIARFKQLLDQGAHPLHSMQNGKSPLDCSTNPDKWMKIGIEYLADKELSTPPPAAVPERKDPGLEALCEACNKGDFPAVKRVIEDGVNPDRECAPGETPLGWASFRGHFHIVSYLIGKGCNVNMRPEHSCGALIDAVRGVQGPPLFGHPELCIKVAEALLKAGADIEVRNLLDHTPLMYAASDGSSEMVWLLLEHGAEVNAKSRDGDTALSLAQAKGHTKVVRILLSRGAVETKEQDLVAAGKEMLASMGVNVLKFKLFGRDTPGHYAIVVHYSDKTPSGDSTKLGSLIAAAPVLARQRGFTLVALEVFPSLDQYNQRARVRLDFNKPEAQTYIKLIETEERGRVSRKDRASLNRWAETWIVDRYDSTWRADTGF